MNPLGQNIAVIKVVSRSPKSMIGSLTPMKFGAAISQLKLFWWWQHWNLILSINEGRLLSAIIQWTILLMQQLVQYPTRLCGHDKIYIDCSSCVSYPRNHNIFRVVTSINWIICLLKIITLFLVFSIKTSKYHAQYHLNVKEYFTIANIKRYIIWPFRCISRCELLQFGALFMR
jgi:hypothetical protein